MHFVTPRKFNATKQFICEIVREGGLKSGWPRLRQQRESPRITEISKARSCETERLQPT